MKVLKKAYFSSTTANSITDLASSILKKCNGLSFSMDRFYDDGTCFRLTTDIELMEHLFQEKIMVTAPVPESLLKKNQFFYVVPEMDSISAQLLVLKQRFHINTVIDFIDRKPGFYDQFWI